ncbi:thioredoxin family protein [Phaeodactylibacter luteus]|uniref:DUF255 domain-containing protein n=1 Tax=Phaeodactylibacter luteus TaxID=1564516 RepID=A0A5C6RKM3_9BACT|nr:thioredoxin fold domain-containing protein [Phaeodactylibacter luteus]TXB62160.1 DUF255 domain-containing protein [Phaeodactylibacter luteus]
MKYFPIPVLALFAVINLSAQAGIQFEQKPWAEILERAEREDKLIFLDAYAEWCGPCKMMSRDVFTDAGVAKSYNAQFVNAKIDMEKGEGVGLAEQYQIRAYPTLLFINGKGELMHRAVGYHDAEAFLALGKDAMDPERQIGALQRKYEAGERSPAFLKNYAQAASQAMDPAAGEIAAAYLNTQDDWSSTADMELVMEAAQSGQEPFFGYLLEHRTTFEEALNARYVNAIIQRGIINALDNSKGPDAMLEQANGMFKKAYGEQAPSLFANFKMNFYRMSGQMEAYAEAAAAYLSEYGSENAQELNSIAWAFYENVEDKDMLMKAVTWAKQSVALEDAFYNNDTLAALYYKLGIKHSAKMAAKHAIALAKANGEDPSETEKLLEKINQL